MRRSGTPLAGWFTAPQLHYSIRYSITPLLHHSPHFRARSEERPLPGGAGQGPSAQARGPAGLVWMPAYLRSARVGLSGKRIFTRVSLRIGVPPTGLNVPATTAVCPSASGLMVGGTIITFLVPSFSFR